MLFQVIEGNKITKTIMVVSQYPRNAFGYRNSVTRFPLYYFYIQDFVKINMQ